MLTDLAGTGAAPGAPYLDFGARLYSPRTATWLSQDPMAEKYYNLSPYAYCAGDPVNLVDPNGKDWIRKVRAKTIYVNMFIYADKNSLESASRAATYWNNRGEDTYTHNKTTYQIKYNIRVIEAKSQQDLDANNSYNVVKGILKNDDGLEKAGYTDLSKNSITIQEKYSLMKPDTNESSSTGAHEIGHLLGIDKHSNGTLMSAYQDENRTLDLNQNQINAIVESPKGHDDFLSVLFNFLNSLF